MISRWLLKKTADRLEEKAPDSALAEVIKTAQSDASTGESHSLLVTRDGVTQVTNPDNVTDQLARLAALHDRGALTDAEFEAQKRQITGA